MIANLKTKLAALPVDLEAFKSIDPVSMRRGGLGAFAGLILILLLSLFTGNSSLDNLDFDTENFSISNLFPKKIEEETLPTGPYAFFNKNKSTLSPSQKQAINTGAPRITLILNNIGQSRKILKSITEKLPSDVTLSLSSYTPTYNAIASDLKSKNFEVWLHLQSQTLDMNNDRGLAALSPAHNLEKNLGYLETQIKGKTPLTGVTFDSTSLIISPDPLWKDLSNELFAEGYGLFENTKTHLPPSFFYYHDKPAPYIKGDMSLNTNIPVETLKSTLRDLTARIKKDKNIILTTTIYTPMALDILMEWVNSFKAAGITLIPLSAQAKINNSR